MELDFLHSHDEQLASHHPHAAFICAFVPDGARAFAGSCLTGDFPDWTLAWWAPGSSKVDYYKSLTFNSGLVFSEISEHFNHFDFLFVVLFLIYNMCKSLSLNNICFIG